MSEHDYWWCETCDQEIESYPSSHICPYCGDTLHHQVYCHACSLAGGADRAVFHDEPVCPLDDESITKKEKP